MSTITQAKIQTKTKSTLFIKTATALLLIGSSSLSYAAELEQTEKALTFKEGISIDSKSEKIKGELDNDDSINYQTLFDELAVGIGMDYSGQANIYIESTLLKLKTDLADSVKLNVFNIGR